MTRESVFAFVVRIVAALYGAVSTAAALFILFQGHAIALPAAIDPSLSIGAAWLSLGILVQLIVVCSFLAAVAESFADTEVYPDLPISPNFDANRAQVSGVVGAREQVTA